MQRQSNLFLRCQNDYAFLLTFSLLKIYFHQAKNMLCTQITKDYTHFLGFLLINLLISHFLFILLSISYSYLILVFYLCFTLYLCLFCACFSTYNFKAMQIVIHVHIIILLSASKCTVNLVQAYPILKNPHRVIAYFLIISVIHKSSFPDGKYSISFLLKEGH